MNAVGIDVSKGKSMVSVMRPLGEAVQPVYQDEDDDEEQSHCPFGPDLSRCQRSFDSPVREDGTQKWVDFAASFWHVDCVRSMSQTAFTERYRKWCKKHGYNFSCDKAAKIYAGAKDQIAVMPKDDLTRRLIRQAIDSLNAVSKTVEQVKAEMLQLSSQLPEFPVVMAMHGSGTTLGPQLMAEIGDVIRFVRRSAITSFAGVDPGADQSGDHESKSVRTSKSGPPELRKALFLVMDSLLKSMPQDDPLYQFMDKKRAEGKPIPGLHDGGR